MEPPRTFYRLVESDPPTLRDFTSQEALGVSPRRRLSDQERDRWRGVSHCDSRAAAHKRGSQSPWLGQYVAEVHVPLGLGVRLTQTGREPSHWTLWAAPADLLSWVVLVTAAEGVH